MTEKNPLLDPGEEIEARLAAAPAADLSPSQLGELLSDTMGHSTSTLDSLAVYRSGKEDYFLRGDEGEKFPNVYGVVLYSQRPMRTWWPSAEITDTPPECWSMDGLHPWPDSKSVQANACAKCPHDKYGSAAKGGGKACKTRASDFLLEIRVDELALPRVAKGAIPVLEPTDSDIIGPALVRYSIGNRESGQFWQSLIRFARERGSFVQAFVCKYGFHRTQSKGGVDYDVVKVEPLAALPSSFVMKHVVPMATALKGGQAVEVLTALSGSGREPGAEG